MKVAMPLAKNVLVPLGLSVAMSAIDGSIKNKMLESGTTTLIISNDEMDDILKIAKSLEDSNVLLKGVSETIQHEDKEQTGRFLSMLLGTLGASLLGDLLSKGLSGKGVIRFFSRDNLGSTVKNGAYVINLDEYYDIGTHWVALYVNNKIIIYFDSFGVEHVPKEIIKFIVRKKIITNIYRIQAYDPIMCGYFCIGFMNFIFNGKSLIDYTNLFSPNDFNKNDNIILNYYGLFDVK